MKLTKTDHHEQALVLMPRIKCLIREGMEAITNDSRLSIELRDDALQFKRFLESPDQEDKPAMFSKTHGTMMNCPECIGTGNEKHFSIDRNLDPEYIACQTCKGEGQLYLEVVRKMYVPTEFHRRKLAK